MLKKSACLSVFLCVSSPVLADQLELSNGDTLQGKIVSMTDAKLVFSSPVLGELEVPMSMLKSFSSDETIKLQLVNGDVVESVVTSEAAGVVEFTMAEQPQRLRMDQIVGINPAPIKPVQWQGKLFAGVNVETGNTKAQNVDIDVKTTRETARDRVILDMRYEEDRSEDSTTGDLATSKRYYALGGHYDHFTTDDIYIYADARTEKEATANLDQRIKLGTGAGYRWIETTNTRFELEGGLSWVSEQFTNSTPDEEYTALRAATRLAHSLRSDLDVFNDAEWLVSLESSDDQLFSMDTGLAYQLNGHISLEAKLHYDWDKSPPAGNGEEDVRYVFGLSWGF